mmetsp:Transcript_33032/g.24314  ORF Transcript_33032/g.24314 Transcript_33032/m.24314 type:complete len:109 (-) Transcript_33032:632-958(-)
MPRTSHKRMVSEVAVGGARAHENIDPEEHKNDAKSNKVIEAMQVGRSKGKNSTVSKFNSKAASRKSSNAGIPSQKKSKLPAASSKSAQNQYINFQKFKTTKKEEEKIS